MNGILKIILSLILLLPMAFAVETATHGSEMFFFTSDRTFTTDAQFNFESILSVSSQGGPKQVFIPRGADYDSTDLPNAVYMCPGNLRAQTESDGTFYQSRFASETAYFSPNSRQGFTCMASNDYQTCKATPYPWPSDQEGYETAIQWSTSASPTVLQKMQQDSSRSAEYTTERSLWDAINTNANVNTDYFPLIQNDFYPDNQAKAGVVCSGKETLTLNPGSGNQNLVRSDGKISPAAIDTPLSSHTWSTPAFLNNKGYNLNLNGVNYAAQHYILSGDINQPACHGVVQLLPFVGDALDKKHFYLQGQAGFSPAEPAQYDIYVVEPDSCYLDAAISPTKLIPPLIPGYVHIFSVSVNNKYDLFDMVATDVKIVEPSYGWAARKSTNPPASSTYNPKHGFDSPILSRETRQLYVDVIIPDPVQDVPGNKICLDITLESAVQFCDENKCTDTTRVCIDIDPSFYCNVTTSPSNVALEPGDDLEMSTTCYLDGNPTECPELTWEAIGSYNSDGVTQNISLVSINDVDGKPPESLSAYSNPKGPYAKPAPYEPSGEKKIKTNSPSIPRAMLSTYNDYPDITAPTKTGDVKVSGIDAQGNEFNCSVQGSNGNFITVEESAKPDYIPIIQIKRTSGTPENNDEVFSITWGTENIGTSASSRALNALAITNGPDRPHLFDGIAAGKTRTWVEKFECKHPGIQRIYLSTDIWDTVVEQPPDGEFNNDATATFVCGNGLVCYDLV